jgi:hypothetical protein
VTTQHTALTCPAWKAAEQVVGPENLSAFALMHHHQPEQINPEMFS